MKTTRHFTAVLLFLAVCAGFSSCKKDKDGDPLDKAGTGLTMKIDNVPWSAQVTTLTTQEHTDGTDGYYAVLINGTVSFENGADGDDFHAESIALYINIPASKFESPKGRYDIKALDNDHGDAWAIFSTSTDIRDAVTYSSLDKNNPDRTVGVLEITGFEIGEQTILGQSTGQIGYTKLSGNFYLELHPVDGASAKLNVTEGKFNLSSGLGISFN
jgi:hypothetical protein